METGSTNTGVDSVDCSSDNGVYKTGEKVWAFYGGQWYEAKVLNVESRMKAWTYFVHYLGWNKRWDQWLGTENLKKFTEEDVHNQSVQCGEVNSKNVKSGHWKKEKICAADENMNIEIPRILKKQLEDDCASVTGLGKLAKLPRTPNVDDILKKYYELRVKNDKFSEDIQRCLRGLHVYFNKALPSMLLYSSERNQYEVLEEMSVGNIPPSKVYGAEHLLRLFVKLPEMFHALNIESGTQKKIGHEILGLLKFLQINQSKFFDLTTYEMLEDSDTPETDL